MEQGDHRHHRSFETVDTRECARPRGTCNGPSSDPVSSCTRLLRCLICRGQLKAVYCPSRTRDEVATAMDGGHEDPERQVVGCVARQDREECEEPRASPQVSAACSVKEELKGYATVDSGATRSMNGIQLMAHVQKRPGLHMAQT